MAGLGYDGAMPKPKIRPMRKSKGIRIGVIPDTQDKPDAPKDHATWIGRWVADRNPDVLIHLGDGPDMGSCSNHDEPGSLAAEGRSIGADLLSWDDWLTRFDKAANGWDGKKHVAEGNHEGRIYRYINANPETRDSFGKDPFGYKRHGWTVHPFLKPFCVAGTWFCHFFPRSSHGRVMQNRNGAPNALTMIRREMRSCVAGHLQGLDVACLTVGGRTLRGVIAGSCYLHTEDYLTPQGQGHWAGVLELNEAHNGYFDLCEVSLEYLFRRYGGGKWPK